MLKQPLLEPKPKKDPIRGEKVVKAFDTWPEHLPAYYLKKGKEFSKKEGKEFSKKTKRRKEAKVIPTNFFDLRKECELQIN